jgi:nicotinamide mononucleotide adenylyltransferase
MNKAIFTFGRFNPPTKGHLHLFDFMSSTEPSSDLLIFTSSTQNAKNPLPYHDKLKFMCLMFNEYQNNIVEDIAINNMFDSLVYLYIKGYTHITLVVGADRIVEHNRQIPKYNGVEAKHGFYSFESISIISSGERNQDATDVSSVSSTKARQLVIDNDLDGFVKLYDGIDYSEELYHALSKVMINRQ